MHRARRGAFTFKTEQRNAFCELESDLFVVGSATHAHVHHRYPSTLPEEYLKHEGKTEAREVNLPHIWLW